MDLFTLIIGKVIEMVYRARGNPPAVATEGEKEWGEWLDKALDQGYADAEARHGVKLDRNSIVDLLKAVGFDDEDATLEARTALAKRWKAPKGVMSDTAKMNTWLFEQAMDRLRTVGHL